MFEPKLIECNNWGGAAAGELEPCKQADKLRKAFHGAWLTAYMLRRFGPPNHGSDPDKNLCSWTITTPLDGLALLVNPYVGDEGKIKTDDSIYTVVLSFGWRWSQEFREKFHTELEKEKWWRDSPYITECNNALGESIKSLLRPVHVRDIAITPSGRLKDDDKCDFDSVCRFEDAGYPCKVDKE